uniref:TAR DNA-binding protein 43 N-terminal domain-containing protein n=1 Tax=Panagrolaimus sp. JU765 TaxID=591449 RepID=A0AC34RH80_9BILA
MESEYVSVQSEFSGTSMDFPVTNDCVNLGTLKSAFPYAHGLVYQEENRTRVVEFDADTKKFILPVGWKSKMFRVICKNGPASTTEETFTTSTAEVSSLYAGLSYALIGYDEPSQELNGNEHIFPTFLRGRIMSGLPHKRGHVCGSSDGVPRLSGGGVFATGNIWITYM